MRGGKIVVKGLEAEGVCYIAGVSGDATYEILDAVYDSTQIKDILVRHEQASVYMSDGYARASGRIGLVSLVTKGPGNGNVIAALGNAFIDSVPVILLQGQGPQHLLGKGVLQEGNHLDIVRSVTKWAIRVPRIDRIPDLLRRAFTVARAGRPGPVMLEIPQDVLSDEVDEAKVSYVPSPKDLTFGPSPNIIQEVVDLLLSAERPLLYVGHGVLWSGATQSLIRLAEILGIPVMSTLNGKSAFPEKHSLSLGLGGYPCAVYSTPMAYHFSKQADVVLAIGVSFGEYATCQWLPIPSEVKLIHVDVNYREFGKAYPATLSILGDSALVLEQMLSEVLRRGPLRTIGSRRTDVEKKIAEIRKDWEQNWMPKLQSSEKPINPYRVTWEFMQCVNPEKAIVLHDAGTVRAYVAHHYMSNGPRSFIGFGGNSAMGWSIPAAIGAKLAQPNKEVFCFVGDGSFGMTGMEVETAARYKIKVNFLIINNNSLNAVRMGQSGYFDKRYMWTDLSADYAKVCEGLGAFTQKVDEPEDLNKALNKVLAYEGGPTAIEIIVKPMEPLPYAGPKPPYPNRPIKRS